MPAAEKSAMRRERRRMRTFQHQVLPGVDKRALFLRVAPPEHEHQALALAVEHFDNGVRELLPTLVLMASSSPGFHGERCIEQEDALLRPVSKMAVIRRLDPQIIFQLDENILQAGRNIHSRPHGKTKAVRLIRSMVRILTEDDHLDFVERSVIERRKVFRAARVDDFPCRDFLFQEFAQVAHIRPGKLREESRLPRRLYPDAVAAVTRGLWSCSRVRGLHPRRGLRRAPGRFRGFPDTTAQLPDGAQPHLLEIALAPLAHRFMARTSAYSRPRCAG